MIDKKTIDDIVQEITPGLVDLRRIIHRYPELGFEEHKTSKLVAGTLQARGIETTTGVGRTGVVGLIRGARPGPVVGIRADMDALPITEATGLPFASEVPGVMHACGHDAHIAIALGAAEVLFRLRDHLPGQVKVIFQPAEEGLRGARAMIEDGVLDNPAMDMVLGFHNWPPIAGGAVAYHPRAVMASNDVFVIELKGKGGHAAYPHLAVDTIVGAAYIVTSLQTIISREVAPVTPAVLSVVQIQGGTPRSVIADSVMLRGTVRTHEPAVSQQIESAMRRMLDGACASMRLSYTLDWQASTPALINDAAVLAKVVDASRDILGAGQVVEIPDPSMGSEDFAYFSSRVPAAHLRIGSKIEGLETHIHHANYDCNELAIPTGVRAIAYAAARLLEGGA